MSSEEFILLDKKITDLNIEINSLKTGTDSLKKELIILMGTLRAIMPSICIGGSRNKIIRIQGKIEVIKKKVENIMLSKTNLI